MAQNGFTPIHEAARKGKVEAITALLAAKADVHAVGDVRLGGRGEGQKGKGGLACDLHFFLAILRFESEIVDKPRIIGPTVNPNP